MLNRPGTHKLTSLSCIGLTVALAPHLLPECAHARAQLIRASIANHTGNALLPLPPRPTIYAYGTVVLSQQASLLSQLPQLVPGDGALSDLPLPMEEYGQQCAPKPPCLNLNLSLVKNGGSVSLRLTVGG